MEGRSDQSAALVNQACSLIDRLLARDSSQIAVREYRVTCMAMRSSSAIDRKQPEEALRWAGRSLAEARAMPQSEAIVRQDNLVRAYIILGNSYRAAGNVTAARTAWVAALGAWPRVVTDNPRQIAIRVELLKALGRDADARPLAGRLRAMGYKVMV